MIDQELFELCKEVYKRTGWENTEYSWYRFADGIAIGSSDLPPERWEEWLCRAYTSDYLLEKLPIHTSLRKPLNGIGGGYEAEWYKVTTQEKYYEFDYTPLKALLKLVIALSDAGVKL